MVKLVLGLILILPAVALFIASWAFALDNPAMTETQLWLSIGWMPVVAMIFIVPALVLINAGWEEYAEPE